MKIFSGSSNLHLATNLAKSFVVPLGRQEIFLFPDGERRVQIKENVLDLDTVVVQATSTPVDENYMELFFLIDGLQRSGARTVSVVMPYFGYQRQDHVFRDGEAVSLQVITRILDSFKIQRLISFDLHTIRIPSLFRTPVTHLSALPLFAEIIKNDLGGEDACLVAPDMGGIRRIRQMADMLQMPYVTVVKNRDLARGSLTAEQFEGEVKPKVFLVDDMVSSGRTLLEAAELMVKNGAEELYAFATHAVFAANAPDILQESLFKKIYVTDTVFVPENKKFAKLEIVSVVPLLKKALES